MNLLKSALRNLLLSAGYDIRKTSHIGLDVNADIQRIFGKRPLRTILDVGAHRGESAVEYAEKFQSATIYSFEPSPQTFEILCDNVDRWPRIKPIQCALGANHGTQRFFLNKFSATNSFLPALPSVAHPDIRSLMENVEATDVSVRTLDAFCSENLIGSVDLLKLDVQGFESAVLAGGRTFLEERRIALLYTEVTFEKHYAEQTTFPQLYATLAEAGFEFVDVYGQTRRNNHSIRWCDMLFVNPDALERVLI